jgi:hypothetical protein
MESVGLSNGSITGWDFRLPQYDEEDNNYEFDFGDRLLPTRIRKSGSIFRTDALVKLLNRARFQAVCFDHKEVTILHILSAATLTFEAFDTLANLKVDRVAVGAACIQRMSELEPKLPAPHPASWPAPGSEDTELGVSMEPEVDHGEAEIYARVQA